MTRSKAGSSFLSGFGTEDFLGEFATKSGKANAFINVAENEKQYLLEVALPGFSRDDINVEVRDADMIISATRQAQGGANEYQSKEFDTESFLKRFRLPMDADAVSTEAIYENGMISIIIPRILSSKSDNSKIVKIH